MIAAGSAAKHIALRLMQGFQHIRSKSGIVAFTDAAA